MENKLGIEKKTHEDAGEIKLSGRIDAYWTEHLNTFLDEEIRAGNHLLNFDLDDVYYISSFGIRLFIKYHKQLSKINGQVYIRTASEAVRTVFSMAGLDNLFNRGNIITEQKSATAITFETENSSYSTSILDAGASLELSLFGNPSAYTDSSLQSEDCINLEFNKSRYAIGLGALGSDVKAGMERIGEFIGLCNVAAYLPTDGTNKPDFLIGTGNLLPSITAVYGILLEGNFSTFTRFTARPDKHLKLSEMISDLMQIMNCDDLAVIMLGETSGLVGAAVNQPPGQQSQGKSIFSFPEIREKLSFTTEPAFNRMLSLTLGIATRKKEGPLMDFVRPMSGKNNIKGHFHAAVFPYMAQKKNNTSLSDTVTNLFEYSQPQHILHLINDERELTGVGESEFNQGICWLGKITNK